jgi:hypothetical protein
MTRAVRTRLTWSRLGIGVSIGLVLFGAIDAALPHSTEPGARISGVGPHETPDSTITTAARPLVSVQNSAAQQIAGEFVEATETTDPTHPEGDTAERAALAPALTAPRRVTWPEAWVAEDRRATVVLDPPGPIIPVGSGQVAVVVTGRTVVTTDVGQTSEVPVDERVTLRPTGLAGSPNASHWVVTDVGSGS